MITALVFVIILGILIFVHELGHFIVARKNGIKADEFGFGFPPRIFGVVKDAETQKWKLVFGNRHIHSNSTIYSCNWIPLGGFVKIKGEDGSEKDEADSFSVKSVWVRIKVLGAGVAMNIILAWFAISIGYTLGAPQAIEDNVGSKNSKVQITQVVLKSPAEEIGLRVGDEIVMCKNQAKVCNKKFTGVSAVKDFISQNKGQEIILEIKRGAQILEIKGVPRTDHPSDEGALGVSLVKTAIISYPVHEAFVRGAITTYDLFITIIVTIAGVVKNLFVGEKIGLDISGPVGIAILSKQVTELGLVYILQFMALLSINLAIINGLPFPALDGGRILFILIEKIKGTPVTQKIEQMIHTVGFFLLISLMVVITFRDLMKIDIIGKIKGIF